MKIANFKADFSTIAYVFVFSIITYCIGICLFASANTPSNAKILLETHRYFSRSLLVAKNKVFLICIKFIHIELTKLPK